jgi:hypothetical protein
MEQCFDNFFPFIPFQQTFPRISSSNSLSEKISTTNVMRTCANCNQPGHSRNTSTKCRFYKQKYEKNGVQNYATAVVSAEIYAKAISPLFHLSIFFWFIGTDQPKVLLILLQSVKLADGLVIVAQLMRIAL